MASSNARPIVPVEILVEQNVIAPMRIVLESRRVAKDRALSFGILEKDVRQPS